MLHRGPKRTLDPAITPTSAPLSVPSAVSERITDHSTGIDQRSDWQPIPLKLWRFLPSSWRAVSYKFAISLMLKYWGQPSIGEQSIARVFPGIIIKYGPRVKAEEYEAMKLVYRYTDIPIPKALDHVVDGNGDGYLVMTVIRGVQLTQVRSDLGDEEKSDLHRGLRHCLEQLRRIPSPWGSKVCSVLGTSFVSFRVGERRIGPFATVKEFHQFLVGLCHPGPSRTAGDIIDRSHQITHRVCFTHGDFKLNNIMMHNGRLSGIIDWETAGWYPEYWEYTLGHYPFYRRDIFPRHMIEVVLPPYDAELDAEHEMWLLTSPY
jgi:serine/threonine protein kinase